MNFLRKLKRELLVLFSKTCIKSARNNYFGLDLRYPIILGMGRGYVVPKEVWMGQCLKAFLDSKAGCVIDVGVNVGVYLVKLKAISNDVEYFGFEPNAVCNYYTNELIRMNNFSNAKVLPLALSDELNVQTLYAGKLGDKTASLVNDNQNPSHQAYSSSIVTVKGDTFIEMLGVKEISVIKIDVEGAELFVLNGLLNTIEKLRPFFYIEIWANDNEDVNTAERITKIYELITSRNYTILGVNSNSKLEAFNTADDLYVQYDPNYIFVPNESLQNFMTKINSIPDCEVKI